MKIAVVLKGYPRLSETFIAQELLALERAGFQLELYSLRHPTDKRTHAIHQALQAPVTYLPEYLRVEPFRVARAILRQLPNWRFWRALGVFLPDLWRDLTINRVRRFGQATVLACEMGGATSWLYAHFIHTPGSVARYAGVIRGLPFSFSAHAKDIWTIPDWEIREKLTAGVWTVCCTKAYSERLRDLAPKADVQLLYHGLDLERFPKRGPSSDGASPFHVVSVARAVNKKGLDTLLQSLARLPADLNWRFSHIGGGPDQTALAELANELGIAERVSFLGAGTQDKVISLLRRGHVFCLPARLGTGGDRDGLPNALMEALSQGLPVIATPVGGIEELINPICGIIVASDNPDQLADAIAELAADPERRAVMGDAGRQRIEDHFSFAQNIEQLVALFHHSLRS